MGVELENIKKDILKAKEFFVQNYPNGANYSRILSDENDALNEYIKYFNLNISKSKQQYNSKLNKALNKWYNLEIISKIMALNKTNKIITTEAFDSKTIAIKLKNNLNKYPTLSYSTETELIR